MADQTNIAGTTSGNNIKLDNVILDVYSQEILFNAQPSLRFLSVAKLQTELQDNPGLTIKFLKYAALSGDSAIAETDTIEATALSTSTVSITVTEHAKAVQASEKLLRSSMTNVLADSAQLLGRHYAKFGVDSNIRDALLTLTNVKYSQAAGSATTRAHLTGASKFNVSLIRDSVELLATNKAPKFDGDAYICFVHPHQARQLRDDPAWVNAVNYASPENILNGEIGRIEDVRFVETTMVTRIPISTQDIYSDGADTGNNTAVAANASTDVYQAIMVGEYCVGHGIALPVEMRDNGVVDYGRKHAIAYYGIWGSGIIESGHGVILETA